MPDSTNMVAPAQRRWLPLLAASLLNLFHGGQAEWLPTFHVTYLCVGAMSMLAALIFYRLDQTRN